MEILDSPPLTDQYIPLEEHQRQTPASFHSGPPVLHHRSNSTILSTTSKDVAICRALTAFFPDALAQTNGSAHPPSDDNDDTEDASHHLSVEDIDLQQNHRNLILFSPTLKTGISIPYPSISLHAIHRTPTTPSLLLHLLATPPPHFDDHDPENTISISLGPTRSSPSATTGAREQDGAQPPPSPPRSEAASPPSPEEEVQGLFAALSACADLHPDALEEGEDIEIDGEHPALPAFPDQADGAAYEQIDGLPPPMPGSGGWITAENVGRFFDEEGNFRGSGGGLGPGAGVVRGREGGGDGDGESGARVGEEEEGDRDDRDGEGVNGGDGETKWRRTG
ncbi:MAG: hypothetical protein LQ350_006424 [Teloschistes chrysophthalmus]|nr:MAG: hypothetical protein LQ350_006424 [Niorma chrysophthalma]